MKWGTDVIREIRALDRAAAQKSDLSPVKRLVFVISANDSPEDAKLYLSSSTGGHVPRNSTLRDLRVKIGEHASHDARRLHRLALLSPEPGAD